MNLTKVARDLAVLLIAVAAAGLPPLAFPSMGDAAIIISTVAIYTVTFTVIDALDAPRGTTTGAWARRRITMNLAFVSAAAIIITLVIGTPAAMRPSTARTAQTGDAAEEGTR